MNMRAASHVVARAFVALVLCHVLALAPALAGMAQGVATSAHLSSMQGVPGALNCLTAPDNARPAAALGENTPLQKQFHEDCCQAACRMAGGQGLLGVIPSEILAPMGLVAGGVIRFASPDDDAGRTSNTATRARGPPALA